MAQDPLSIPTTVLPESTFDPVQFAKERRQEVLTEQQDRRTRYNKAWESVGTPTGMNRSVQQELIARRNKILEEGASKSAEGIDITDISHPKYGRDAMEFRSSLDQLSMDINKTEAIDKLLSEARNMIAKDDKGVIDVTATNANIAKIRSAKSLDEIDQFLASKGDSVIEVAKQPLNVDKYIFDYLKGAGVKGMPSEFTTKEGGFLVTREYNDIPPAELKSAFSGMLNDPKFRSEVKAMRQNDATDLRGGSDLDYLMERKGNRMVRQQTGFKSDYIKPEKADKSDEDKPKYQTSSDPVKTTFSFGKSGSYEATGDNAVIFDQSKEFNVSPGSGTLNIEDSKPANIKGSVKFEPINTSEYTVSTKDYKNWKAGTILPDTEKGKPNTKKVRFVEGIYTEKETKVDEETGREITVEVPKTILVPYENIKNELDVTYKVGKDIPQTKSSNLGELRSKYNY